MIDAAGMPASAPSGWGSDGARRFTRGGLLALGVAVVLRLVLLVAFADQPLAIVDEQQYNAIATNLSQHGEYADAKGRTTALRPPLYPLFLASIYRVAGVENHRAVRAVQAVLGLVLGLLCFVWTRRVFGLREALLAAAVCVLYPTLVLFDFLVLTEVLFSVLFLLVFVCVAEFWRGRHAWTLGLAGLFLALASLTRSVTYPMLAPLAALVVLLSPQRRRAALRGVLLMAAVFGLTLTPWVVRNYRVFGRFVPVDTMGGWNVYLGNFEHTLLHRAWATIDDRSGGWYEELGSRLEGLDEAEKQQWLGREAVTYMKGHPGLTALRSVIKGANLWGLDRTLIAGMQAGLFPALRNLAVQVLVAGSILLAQAGVVIGGVFGLVWRLRHDRRAHDLLVAFVLVYFTAVHAIAFGHPRYLLPLIPLLGAYGAWAAVHFGEIRKAGSGWKAVLSGVVVVFGTIWAYDVLIGSRGRLVQWFGTLVS